MQLACVNRNKTTAKIPLLLPYFYVVSNDADLKSTHKIKFDGYYAFPAPAHNFINLELYATKFERTIRANLAIAETKNIPLVVSKRYGRRLIAEQYCTEYDIEATRNNCLLRPAFHVVHSNNDIATSIVFNEDKGFFYSYPEPVLSHLCSLIDIFLYQRTVESTLKINLIMADERGLDNIGVIKPYVLRILYHIERTSYNMEMIQNSC
jgi:hypothetical protein